MKNIIKYLCALLAVILAASCQEDDRSIGDITTPSNLVVDAVVVGANDQTPLGDGSGEVVFTASADDAMSYTFQFGDDMTGVSQSGEISHFYFTPGENSYTVTVIATGTGGTSTSQAINVDVFSSFQDDELKTFLTGGTTKTWYWAASEPGHLGVGPNGESFSDGDNSNPIYYAAAPFEKDAAGESQCLYMDELVFSLNGDDLEYELLNMGQTYFNFSFEGEAGGSEGFDFCYDYNTDGVKAVTLAPSNSLVPAENKRGTSLLFSDGGFMSYYINTSTYEVLSATENRMVVRAIMGNGNNDLAWYHIFTTVPPADQGGDGGAESLVWSEEFDTDGSPDPSIWNYDLGTGNGGWGNNEEQFYTDDPSNIIVENGMLKITARREPTSGRNFSSSRINSLGKFDFQYGRVEVRAKMPTGGGTWPAIWMMGQDFDTVGWPECGEMDIMEHLGRNQDVIYSTVHYPDGSGTGGSASNGNNVQFSDVSTEFKIYEMTWDENVIIFKTDDQQVFTFAHDDTLPFRDGFFFILNVAMGGNFGGTIDAAFQESTMEVDYIRVYQ